MAQDNSAPADETRVPQARRLAEQALEAERAGDADAAERLFAEAERIDPGIVEAVLEEDEATAAERPARRAIRAGRRCSARKRTGRPRKPMCRPQGHLRPRQPRVLPSRA